MESEIVRFGYQKIAGVDEVGRGSLAGPVVAAAVILPNNKDFPGVDDSKKLSPKNREKQYAILVKEAISFGIGMVGPLEIDAINIVEASFKAMRLALTPLSPIPDYLLVDGRAKLPNCPVPQKPIIHGDALCLSIAAASILAKVTRDRLMTRYRAQFPSFRFDLHKGYGTKQHLEELQRFGPTTIHRHSFQGVKGSGPHSLSAHTG